MLAETRVAVRIVLLDPSSRVLLFEGRDLSDAGGVDGSESLEDAAARELREETGQSGLRVVGPFHRRELHFLDHGEPRHQVEHYFAARTSDPSVDERGWTDLERRAVTTWRWWTTEELAAAGIRYFPDEPVDLLDLVALADDLV